MTEAEQDGNEAQIKSLRQKLKSLKDQAKKSGAMDDAAEVEDAEVPETEVQSAVADTEPTASAEPVASKLNTTEVINDAYLRTLSRYPSAEELQTAQTFIAESVNPVDGIRDVLWALLNTREFIVNH